jgi:hypothetical protein
MQAVIDVLTESDFNLTSLTGSPGTLIPWGWKAVPVIVGEQAMVAMTAAVYGKGRVVVFSHTSYLWKLLDNWNGTTDNIYTNTRTWLANGTQSRPIVVDPTAADELTQDTAVACQNIDDFMLNAIIDFVADGGALIVAVTPWALHLYEPEKLASTEKAMETFGIFLDDTPFQLEYSRTVNKSEILNYHLGALIDIIIENPFNHTVYGSSLYAYL